MTAKQPQDRRKKRTPFEFVIDGETYVLKPPTFGQALELTTAENEGIASMKMMSECMTTEAFEAVKSLDAMDANDLFSDWMKAIGGGDAGKSDGSSA